MDISTVAAFLAIDLLLVLTPGADWAYVISAGLRERAVLPAVAGLLTGYVGYTLLAVAGLVVIVASSATLLTALTFAGAGYLIWLGVLTRPAALSAADGAPADSRARILLRGAGISGLNPKALLLYFSLFPQFIDAHTGWPVAAQTGLLGALHTTACAVVYLTVGLFAGTVLRTRPTAARVVTRVSGVLMVTIGAVLLLEQGHLALQP
ncbi:LysE family translocator [Streptomyces roseirectus]|uniref:LysE family translocator n=1 Tax=Streptomyces roseirectus TaxID=2768066 RepID=A0A7H0IN36_9ACTN|nr:LysE family translocator [Streptomyces roseirectus]QNP74202.1 LysE family translocator [Streptomyces roseirectus]